MRRRTPRRQRGVPLAAPTSASCTSPSLGGELLRPAFPPSATRADPAEDGPKQGSKGAPGGLRFPVTLRLELRGVDGRGRKSVSIGSSLDAWWSHSSRCAARPSQRSRGLFTSSSLLTWMSTVSAWRMTSSQRLSLPPCSAGPAGVGDFERTRLHLPSSGGGPLAAASTRR